MNRWQYLSVPLGEDQISKVDHAGSQGWRFAAVLSDGSILMEMVR